MNHADSIEAEHGGQWPCKRVGILLAPLVIASCAAIERETPATVPTPEPTPSPTAMPKRTRPGPIPTRALNVKADCSFHDETGYNGAMKLHVANAQVHAFEAAVNIPRRGTCNFNLHKFRQSKSMPNVELSAPGSACIVRMWEQGQRVTVAFNQCASMCTGDAFTYLWPILADSHNGSCG